MVGAVGGGVQGCLQQSRAMDRATVSSPGDSAGTDRRRDPRPGEERKGLQVIGAGLLRTSYQL